LVKHGKLARISLEFPVTMQPYLVLVIYIFVEPDAVLILAVPKTFIATIHKTTPGQAPLRFLNGKIASMPRVSAFKAKAIYLVAKIATALI
jgi:hypothetical protein